MRRTIGHKGVLALTIPALLLGAIGLSPQAEAATALDIINTDNDTRVGSIVFPTPTGSSPEGVEFELDSGSGVFTHDDITAISWALDPVLSLDLEALQGANPCSIPAHGSCSNVRLLLTEESFERFVTSCSGPFGFCSTGIFLPTPVAFVATAPAYTCVGFEPPLADGPVTVRGNRALPLKAELLDEDGFALSDADLGAASVVQITYHSSIGADPEDVSDQALWAGQGSTGNRFVFSGDRWRFNLKVGNYSAPGTYTISMISGDDAEYGVDPTCEAQFIVNP